MKAKKKSKLNRLAGRVIRQKIEMQLLQSLEEWKRDLGEKEFIARIKKASKLISKNIVHSTELNVGQPT